MTRRIRLLGRPQIERDDRVVPRPAGRKVWGLLAYLVLAHRPPSRQHLAQLLFSRADDPLGSLRWNLCHLRRALGGPKLATGDPVVLGLDDEDRVDVRDILSGARPGSDLECLADELLEGLSFDAEPAFAAWLDLARHNVRTATQSLLADAAADLGTRAEHASAARLAQRGLLLDEFDAELHALLVRSLVLAGAEPSARRHVARSRALYRENLGAEPPAAIALALAANPGYRGPVGTVERPRLG